MSGRSAAASRNSGSTAGRAGAVSVRFVDSETAVLPTGANTGANKGTRRHDIERARDLARELAREANG